MLKRDCNRLIKPESPKDPKIIALTAEDASQTDLDGEQVYNSRVGA